MRDHFMIYMQLEHLNWSTMIQRCSCHASSFKFGRFCWTNCMFTKYPHNNLNLTSMSMLTFASNYYLLLRLLWPKSNIWMTELLSYDFVCCQSHCKHTIIPSVSTKNLFISSLLSTLVCSKNALSSSLLKTSGDRSCKAWWLWSSINTGSDMTSSFGTQLSSSLSTRCLWFHSNNNWPSSMIGIAIVPQAFLNIHSPHILFTINLSSCLGGHKVVAFICALGIIMAMTSIVYGCNVFVRVISKPEHTYMSQSLLMAFWGVRVCDMSCFNMKYWGRAQHFKYAPKTYTLVIVGIRGCELVPNTLPWLIQQISSLQACALVMLSSGG